MRQVRPNYLRASDTHAHRHAAGRQSATLRPSGHGGRGRGQHWPGLRKAALAGRVDGKLVDTSFLVSKDASVAIVTDKDPDALSIIRHSTAHLLAQAVKELFPNAQVTIGPVIEDGFYYDFAFERPFTPEDLIAIESRMRDLAEADQKVSRRVLSRDEAVRFFTDLGEHYKAEIIAAIPARTRSASTGRATGSTCAAGRTCPPRGG